MEHRVAVGMEQAEERWQEEKPRDQSGGASFVTAQSAGRERQGSVPAAARGTPVHLFVGVAAVGVVVLVVIGVVEVVPRWEEEEQEAAGSAAAGLLEEETADSAELLYAVIVCSAMLLALALVATWVARRSTGGSTSQISDGTLRVLKGHGWEDEACCDAVGKRLFACVLIGVAFFVAVALLPHPWGGSVLLGSLGAWAVYELGAVLMSCAVAAWACCVPISSGPSDE